MRSPYAAAGLGGCLLYLIVAFGVLTLFGVLLRGVGWIAENIYPWVMLATAIALIVVVPISLLLSIFRKSRGVGSVGLLLSSYVVGLNLWMWSLIVASSLAGTFWLIVGLLFAGIGVVPIAFIAALLSSEWSVAGQILITTIVVFLIRGFSNFVANRTGQDNPEVENYVSEQFAPQDAIEVTQEFGGFLSKGSPVIADARLLPYPKSTIKQALLTYEQHLCDIANGHVASGHSQKLAEVETLLNAVRSCSVAIEMYADIDPQDAEAVSYFNSFQNIKDVPTEEQKECVELLGKYMTKGMESEM